MKLEKVACPLCSKDDPSPWGQEAGFHAVRCGGCGLVYVSPRPIAETITEASRLGQHETEAGVLDVKFKRSKKRVAELRRLTQRMHPDIIDAGKAVTWLDVGAGYGEFVEALNGVLPEGSAASGIEPMEHKV